MPQIPDDPRPGGVRRLSKTWTLPPPVRPLCQCGLHLGHPSTTTCLGGAPGR